MPIPKYLQPSEWQLCDEFVTSDAHFAAYLLFFCCRTVRWMILIKSRLLEKSSFNSADKRQGMRQRGADHNLSGRLAAWCSSFNEHQEELVLEEQRIVPTPNCSPTQGAQEEKHGHQERVFPPMALPSVFPPPSPPTHLTPSHWPLSSYIPGALFFAGKHSSATAGEVELFSGINGNSAQTQLPVWSYLLCGHQGLKHCCVLLCRHGEILMMQDFKIIYTK